LGLVIFYSNGKGFFSPDQHHQFFSPGNACIDQIPLEEHIMLGRDRDNHNWILASLRFVHRDSIAGGDVVYYFTIINPRCPLGISHPSLPLQLLWGISTSGADR